MPWRSKYQYATVDFAVTVAVAVADTFRMGLPLLVRLSLMLFATVSGTVNLQIITAYDHGDSDL